ncbi:hypothetical protein LTR95_014452 [Oleoguttula sp. CCFEE 5521]
MEKYRYHLRLDGASTPSALFRVQRTLKQVDWAVAVQDGVAKLKSSITPQLAALCLLLQQIYLDKLASRGHNISENLTAAHDILRRVSAMQPYMQLSEATCRNTDSLLQDLAGLRVQTSGTATQDQLSDLASALHDVARQRDVLVIGQNLASIETQLTSMHVHQIENVASTRDLEVSMTARLDSIQAKIEHVSHKPEDDITNRNARQASYKSQASFHELDIAPDFLAHIDRFLAALRTHIIAVVAMLLWLVPSVRLFMSTALTVVRSPTLLLSDNILLTDVLGRKLTLPYQHFRFYAVLVARLRSAFEGCPGQQALSAGNFGFFVERGRGVSVLIDSAELYESVIAPRKKLIMSILSESPSGTSCASCHKAAERTDYTLPGWIIWRGMQSKA